MDNPDGSHGNDNTTESGGIVSIVKLSGSVSKTGDEEGLRLPAPDVGSPTLAFSSEDDSLAFGAIETGCRTYGAIATATRIGATRAFQAVERLKEAGRIRQAKDGSHTIAEGQT